MSYIPTIHPFPARMAPEIVLQAIKNTSKDSYILDPMMGSGTVLRFAADNGFKGIGFDLDPLSVILTKVWTTPINVENLRKTARQLVFDAIALRLDEIYLPWIDDDEETEQFIKFWFAVKQRNSLRKLSFFLSQKKGNIANALRLCLSRIIITKSKGASLAGDVSHSRPHRIRTVNDYQVYDEFLKAVEILAKKIEKNPPAGNIDCYQGDARKLRKISDASVDAIISSPPYLNAIDYMRGHKLALVWLGYTIDELRSIRASSVGVERGHKNKSYETQIDSILDNLPDLKKLPNNKYEMIRRYAGDMKKMLEEAKRVIKPGGYSVYVIGNSCLKGIYIENTKIITLAALNEGFELISSYERDLPQAKRYLPPPKKNGNSSIHKRMRKEAVITLKLPPTN